MPRPELAVIVTTFQMPWHLRRALESIACQQTGRRLEVVVADDGSQDETARVVQAFASQAKFPVRFVTHAHSGFHPARSRNEGVRHSTADYLLFFDGDCVIPPDHIERHFELWQPGTVPWGYCVRLEQSASYAVTLDMVRSGEFVRLASPEEHSKLRAMHVKSLYYELLGHPTKPAFRSTDFFLSRADYARVNGFDEQFRGWGCEDDDFGRRLRAAGVRPVSALHRTCAYHLWHAPATTKPKQWKQGSNVAYLQRPIRLTRCLQGLTPREPHDLTVRIAGDTPYRSERLRLLVQHGWRVEAAARMRTDLELVCRPGSGRFSGRADCRVLAVVSDGVPASIDTRLAHVVLSPDGQIGLPSQARLPLDDVAGLWRVLMGEHPSAEARVAASAAA